MPEQAFTIAIKPAEESQLDVLEHEFSPATLSKYHYKRYEVQKHPSPSRLAFRSHLHVLPSREMARTRAPFIEGEGPEDPQATAQAQTHIGIPER